MNSPSIVSGHPWQHALVASLLLIIWECPPSHTYSATPSFSSVVGVSTKHVVEVVLLLAAADAILGALLGLAQRGVTLGDRKRVIRRGATKTKKWTWAGHVARQSGCQDMGA